MIATMEQLGALVERSLREFGPTLLGCYEQDGVLFWEPGELFSFLINGVWRKVRFPTGLAHQVLPDARLTFGGGLLEIQHGARRRYATMLSIKEFAGQVEPGTLGAYVVTDHVDELYARVQRSGATVLRELTEQSYGGREFSVADPEGNLWSFGSYRGEPRS